MKDVTGGHVSGAATVKLDGDVKTVAGSVMSFAI